MPRPIRRACAVAVAASAALAPAAASAAQPSRVDSIERAIVRNVNHARLRYGLPGLRLDRRLTIGANVHSTDMARHDFFSHSSWNGRSAPSRVSHYARVRTVGEVIAWARGLPRRRQAGWVVGAWLRSPEHRAILLSRRYRRIGVARRRGHGRAFFTVDVAAPR